jgi:hypothetical protein
VPQEAQAKPFKPLPRPKTLAPDHACPLTPEQAKLAAEFITANTAPPPGQPDPKGHMTDAEWVQSLPAYGQLHGEAVELFAEDAIFYRHIRNARSEFVHAFYKAKGHTFRARRFGEFARRTLFFIGLGNPETWTACRDCGGTGKGREKKCKACDGAGYLLVTIPELQRVVKELKARLAAK